MGMDAHLKVIEALANGVDPTTGEVLANESPYNNPEVIRALFSVIKHLHKPIKKQSEVKTTPEQKQAENIKNNLPKNAGLPWTQEQKSTLAEFFTMGESIALLAEKFGRSRGAIAFELKKQGLIGG